ncbi:MAG TPA: hypothetical protein VMU42_08985 [Candidatus Sulfotelmatobacter sp.]|nr:hypothetical protein [Candidatus Sulfotelmatobacter sp.]
MREEFAAHTADQASVDNGFPRYAVVFETEPLQAGEIAHLVDGAARSGAGFIGVVSSRGLQTALPLHQLLSAAEAPVHFFPAGLRAALLQSLRKSNNIPVLGRGSDPRAALIAYLEAPASAQHSQTTEQQAVA